MMKFLKKIQKSIKAHHLLLLGVIVAYFAIIMYSDKKSQVLDLMTPHADKHLTKANPSQSNSTNKLPQPSNPLGENEDFEQKLGINKNKFPMFLANCSSRLLVRMRVEFYATVCMQLCLLKSPFYLGDTCIKSSWV